MYSKRTLNPTVESFNVHKKVAECN